MHFDISGLERAWQRYVVTVECDGVVTRETIDVDRLADQEHAVWRGWLSQEIGQAAKRCLSELRRAKARSVADVQVLASD